MFESNKCPTYNALSPIVIHIDNKNTQYIDCNIYPACDGYENVALNIILHNKTLECFPQSFYVRNYVRSLRVTITALSGNMIDMSTFYENCNLINIKTDRPHNILNKDYYITYMSGSLETMPTSCKCSGYTIEFTYKDDTGGTGLNFNITNMSFVNLTRA